jgi:hypothetical protein
VSDADVSAVVLSVGEPYLGRALESLRAQTAPLRDIIVVEDVSPFHRAMNEGARKVRTPFFVQVDADMVLDTDCVEVLRSGVRDDTGLVIAELRDALLGRVFGVKLFRAACFQAAAMPDSIDQDVEFGKMLRRQGWKRVHMKRRSRDGEAATLGEHRPDYTAAYTYRKFLVDGARLRHRGREGGAREVMYSRFASLEATSHPMATIAQVALAHGFFLPWSADELKPPKAEPRAEWLVQLLLTETRIDGLTDMITPPERHARLRDVFYEYLAASEAMRDACSGRTFREVHASVSCARRDIRALVAKMALGHGLLRSPGEAPLEHDELRLARFVTLGLGSDDGAWSHVRARARQFVQRLSRGEARVPW